MMTFIGCHRGELIGMNRKSECGRARNLEGRESFDLLSAAPKPSDTSGKGKAPSAMRCREERGKNTSEGEELISGYKDLLDKEEKGLGTFITLFTPYSGSVEEMFELCSMLEGNPGKGLILLIMGTENFLSAPLEYSPDFGKDPYPYLEKWLLDLVELIHSHIGEFMNEKEENGFSGSFALASLISALISDTHFSSAVERSFRLFPESMAEAEISFPGPYSPLNTAVIAGDMDTFAKFHDMENVRKLIYPKRSCSRGKLYCYPEKNTLMIDRLFSLGLLLPGTEEGKRAFFYILRHFNPSREIIMRIKHPSYFRNASGYSLSPLVSAVRNSSFSPDNYDLLIESGCDISGYGEESGELPPIAWAVESRDERKVKSLISLGADMSWHDRWGNNILHRLIAKGWKTDGSGYEKLYNEKNIFARTPSDYASPPSRRELAELRRITFHDALDTLLSSPKGRTYFFFEDGGFHSFGEMVDTVMEYLAGKPELSDAVLGRIETKNALRHFRKVSADGKGRYLLFLSPDCFLRDALIRDLEERENVTLFFTVLIEQKKFRVVEYMTENDNIFVSRTTSSLSGDILIGNGLTASLKKDELILKTDGEYYLVQIASRPRKGKYIVSQKSFLCNSGEDGALPQ